MMKLTCFAVKYSDKKLSSNTTPVSSFISFSFFTLSFPNIFIVPSDLVIFNIDLIVVVLPAPFSPISPTIQPCGTLKLIFLSSKSLYFFETFCNSILFSIL